MKCEYCSNDANIEIAINFNGQVRILHLCESCYREKMEDFMKLLPDGAANEEMESSLTDQLKELLSKQEHKTIESGSDRAYRMQRKALRRKRADFMNKLEEALDQEDYEHCALYRDEIARISDELVRLNREREDVHGA